MTSPAIGSRWRSKRSGDIGTVNNVFQGMGSVQLRMDYPPRMRLVSLTTKGRPCGYERAEEVERD